MFQQAATSSPTWTSRLTRYKNENPRKYWMNIFFLKLGSRPTTNPVNCLLWQVRFRFGNLFAHCPEGLKRETELCKGRRSSFAFILWGASTMKWNCTPSRKENGGRKQPFSALEKFIIWDHRLNRCLCTEATIKLNFLLLFLEPGLTRKHCCR